MTETKQDVFNQLADAYNEMYASVDCGGYCERYANAPYKLLPLIPQNVANCIENYKRDATLARFMYEAGEGMLPDDDVSEWVNANSETAARAWLDGYKIEEDKMNYYKSVEAWAKERGLDKADPKAQLNKLMEEVGELAQGVNKNNLDQITDSLGDVQVVLTVLALQLGDSQEDCFEAAYNVIKNRTGKMFNGVFVKDSDAQ